VPSTASRELPQSENKPHLLDAACVRRNDQCVDKITQFRSWFERWNISASFLARGKLQLTVRIFWKAYTTHFETFFDFNLCIKDDLQESFHRQQRSGDFKLVTFKINKFLIATGRRKLRHGQCCGFGFYWGNISIFLITRNVFLFSTQHLSAFRYFSASEPYTK